MSSPAKAGGLGDQGRGPARVVGYPLSYSQMPLETSLGPDVSICSLDLGSRMSSLLFCLPASCLPCPGPLRTAGTESLKCKLNPSLPTASLAFQAPPGIPGGPALLL